MVRVGGIILFFFYFLLLSFLPSFIYYFIPQCRTYKPNAHGSDPLGELQIIYQNIRPVHKGRSPSICGQLKSSVTARDNIEQKIKDKLSVPG